MEEIINNKYNFEEYKITTLHGHSTYSILDGMGTPEEILQECVRKGIKSYAITEHGNQYSWYYFAELQKKYPSVKLLYGVELYECLNHTVKDAKNKYFHLICIAKNERGIKAINQLITDGELEHENSKYFGKPRVDLEQIKKYEKDLIITTACLGSKFGKIFQNSISAIATRNLLKKTLQEYKETFSNFYVELQSHGNDIQMKYNRIMLDLANELNIKYVITTDSHYLDKEDSNSHAYYVNINRKNADISENSEGFQKSLDIYEDCYLQSAQITYDIMSKYNFTEQEVMIAFETANSISDIIDGKITFSKPQMPHIEIPKEYKDEEEWILALLEEGWNKKIKPYIQNGCIAYDPLYSDDGEIISYVHHEIDGLPYKNIPLQQYKDRLKEEFDTMKDMGFFGYHLIVADICKYAKNSNIPLAWGRGSASGSLINFLLDITGIDPLPFGLLFSRYINRERISMPDIDSDFASSKRQKVFDYIVNKYGVEYVAQIISFVYMTPLVAWRASCKLLRVPRAVDNFIAEFMCSTYEETIEVNIKNKQFTETMLEYPEAFKLTKDFTGKVSHIMTNACGTVISSTPINTYCGMLKGDDGQPLLQTNKIVCEKLGLVKIDVLGTRILDVLQKTLQRQGLDFDDLANISLNDKATYEMMASGNTSGIFQLGSTNMTNFFKKLKPQNILDVCAGISLYRPASIKYLDDYIKFKEDMSLIKYPHESMGAILDETKSIIVYQEQIMQLLQSLAGFSFARADIIRRAVGKKIVKYILAQEKTFIYGNADTKTDDEELVVGCINNGISEEDAKNIFQIIIDAGKYCFNKSHGLSYALITYYSAYLKTHYTTDFMIETLNCCDGKPETISKFIEESKHLGISILQPDINKSDRIFTRENAGIRFGLAFISNVGEESSKQIVNNRPYANLVDFIDLIGKITKSEYDPVKDKVKETKIVDKSCILNLITAGAFDELNSKQLVDKSIEDGRTFNIFTYFRKCGDFIKSLTVAQIVELQDRQLLDGNFQTSVRISKLFKEISKRKYKLNIKKDEEIINRFLTYFETKPIMYSYEGNTFLVNSDEFKLAKKEIIDNDIGVYLKDNKEELTLALNKARLLDYHNIFMGDNSLSDLEFKSCSCNFIEPWYLEVENNDLIDKYSNIRELNLNKSTRYKPNKPLSTIVGTYVGKDKVHSQIQIVSSSGTVLVKFPKKLYQERSGELSKGSRVAISGFKYKGIFHAEYYTNGKMDSLSALKIL